MVLTPRKEGVARHFLIEDEETLILLNNDGTRMMGESAERYVLHRSDTVKSREMHLH